MENNGQPTTDTTASDTTPADETDAADVSSAPDVPADQDELAVLDQLEADLAAVEQAITTLEQISTDGSLGDSAASQIAAAVPQDRFASAGTPDQI
jgi:hypothetical protein